MKKRKLKPFAKIFLGVMIVVILLSGVMLISNTTKEVSYMDDFTYVNDYIFDDYYPVISNSDKIIRPYSADNISVYRNFYEKDDAASNQEKSIVLSDGTYIQNSGVDYSSDNTFDVISVLDGTVTNVTEDTVLGKTVEIKSSNDIVATYQSLSEISVKKGDTVSQGDVIGKSGTCNINNSVKNSLHFEIYKSGQVLNPEKVYDKSIKEIEQ